MQFAEIKDIISIVDGHLSQLITVCLAVGAGSIAIAVKAWGVLAKRTKVALVTGIVVIVASMLFALLSKGFMVTTLIKSANKVAIPQGEELGDAQAYASICIIALLVGIVLVGFAIFYNRREIFEQYNKR